MFHPLWTGDHSILSHSHSIHIILLQLILLHFVIFWSHKILGPQIWGITFAPNNFASVELFVFIFCFIKKLVIAPCLNDMIAHECPLHSECIAYAASMYQMMSPSSSINNVSFSPLMPLKYLSTLFSPPNHSHMDISWVVRNATAVCMSCHMMELSCHLFWQWPLHVVSSN